MSLDYSDLGNFIAYIPDSVEDKGFCIRWRQAEAAGKLDTPFIEFLPRGEAEHKTAKFIALTPKQACLEVMRVITQNSNVDLGEVVRLRQATTEAAYNLGAWRRGTSPEAEASHASADKLSIEAHRKLYSYLLPVAEVLYKIGYERSFF